MNVRRTETPVAPLAAVSVASLAAAVRAPVTPAASGFDGATASSQTLLARAENGQTRITQSILPGDMYPVAPGPLALTSPAAQKAIASTQQFLVLNLGLGGTGQGTPEFQPRAVEMDVLGMTHVRMDRLQDGLKVFGEQVVAHLDVDGNVLSLTGGEGLSSIPANVSGAACVRTPAEALAKATATFGRASQHAPVVEQVLFQKADGSYTKAYRVEVTDFTTARPERMNYMVDGATGEILDQWNQMGGIELPKNQGDLVGRPGNQGTGTGEAGADDRSLYSGQVEIGATQNADGGWTLNDTGRGKGVETRDANNKSSGNGSTPITDQNNLWGEVSDSPRSHAAVDAQYGAQMTYDMYRQVLGRDSIDGKGEKLLSNVHVRSNYVNAFWDGKQMSYGDGDGKTSGPLTTLDIAGHEISHGLTERTAGLIYRNESGGINESMSDILGTGVEWFASQKNSAVKFDWTLGEDCWTPNNGDATDGLRYMNDPTKDRYSIDHYSNYPKQTEVHGSSGIMNNAFFLLAEGGTNRTSRIEVQGGVGVEKGLQIYGRALMFYMTPNTTFAQAREATVKAATDLFGADSVEVRLVRESWTAVGVN
ncbi:MAG: M4 family metallopeptidase [Myxococcota bacterium]|nr:M4 family metallopeptidase [Myxococcota bacterium]